MTQPENALKEIRETGLATQLPLDWRMPLARLAVASLALIALCAREWGEMIHQWWNIDTYNHILLIPLLLVWLVALRMDGLRQLKPAHWLPGVGILAAALGLWTIGRATEINLIAQAGAVGALQAAIVTFLGPRLLAYLLLPAGMMIFLVPFGDEIIPFLQMITAKIAIALTMWSGIEATFEGIYINTPVGLFIVAEECSGVKFLVAMVTLGVLVSFTCFSRWKHRAIFMAACFVVPILANGVRAWSTIYIAQSQGVEFAAGFDHIVYGWVFFAIVMAIVLGGAFRFFDREPEDAGYSVEQLDKLGFIGVMEKRAGSANMAMLGAGGVLLGFAILAIYLNASVV